MHLDGMPLDVGYSSEKVIVQDSDGKEHTIGGQDGTTQLFITTPFIDDQFIEELKEIHDALPSGGEYEVKASLIVANENHKNPEFEKFNFYIDKDEEVGDFYGVKIADAPCEGELTKAIILISKDGAIFYDEFVKSLHDKFNIETLNRKIYAAQTCYTGKGCH